jgi:hypothetical protein
MSALDKLLDEIKAHPNYRQAVAAGVTAGQVCGDLKPDDPDATLPQLLEAIAGLFEQLRTVDSMHAIEVHDQAVKIVSRTNRPIGERIAWLHNFLLAADGYKLGPQ